MTNREFYTAIAAVPSISADLKAFAEDALSKLDKRNDKRRETPTKAQVANAPIKDAIAAVLTDSPKVASEVAAAVGVSTQKASALLRQLVDEGVAVATTVKVKGKGELKAYYAEGADYAVAMAESAATATV